ncbi:MAG: transglutaminase family protein [Acidihalobacter sp.]|uniref:transglutaminase family protein n=1 Tax=Acidihalobacter sp. TaxID=1872108 RepID=UPI00307FC35C
MAIRVAIRHTTHYRFDRRVGLAPHVIRLRPAAHARTPIESYSLKIEPAEHFINWQQDPFGNYLARLTFPEPTRELLVNVEVIADLVSINPFDFFLEPEAEHYPFQYATELATELRPYFEIRESGPRLMEWLREVNREETPTVDFLVAINQRLQRDIGYIVRMEPGIQSCEESLEIGRGSCRDSAWLLVQILRHLGLAARFVSGYLVQLVADEKPLEGPEGTTHDFTDLHAWTEVYLPGAGWVGLDPTSGLFAGEGHIPLACTPKPSSAAPIAGATDHCEVEFEFVNEVTRIHEDPRVTKPYDDAAWADILALGRKVDADLDAGDVRLTLGGEPTFVSVDDMDGAQWNTLALGEHKRERAGDLFKRLAAAFAQSPLLHYGQGKWYPGEALPRWALSCYWRRDGAPLWRDPALLADDCRDYGHGAGQAHAFASGLAKRLGLDGERNLVPGFEDPLYHLWNEANQPSNVDWLTADLKHPEQRAELAVALSRGLDQAVGYALPLAWDWRRNAWRTGPWQFRRGSMHLIPGTSPMGLRLPLDSLPWTAEKDREITPERSGFEQRPPLSSDLHGEVETRYTRYVESPKPALPEAPPSADACETEPGFAKIPHTALCIEARAGRLHLFMPPLTHLEHYAELLAAIENTAAELALPVVIEGYTPPRDPRLKSFAVTPDPGVIEVNIHPASNWEELAETTERLYEEARLARLGTEKFMLDGRHTGTGGGNHVTLGGAAPEDSPFLRRPDLLASLITYWQHHPSLSYCFSGMFIGPTSQAPRADEGRDEYLYELEIALSRIPPGETPAPWLIDRLLRNLLVDITGNTHRAEFCIDKLYSPDSATGRLGLVEFRAFEMPPHARMSLVQLLLIRALVARFWRTPYRGRLVRWGTELHDRWMLPHYIEEDLRDICAELSEAGYPFAAEWFAPFVEFRFPVLGRVQLRGIEIELRMALEPWPVLGEEASAQGTARFVDSSVERLQVRVSGLSGERYVLACNGRRVPLRATGTKDEAVAGVRYRAWQPPSALHPTIGVHVPLVFDLIDTWNGRSVGGCTYHVAHPGGRSYETFPVNAYEAEGRRITRFSAMGHTQGPLRPPPASISLGGFHPEGHPPGPMAPPVEPPNRDYPYTLDLRRE